ncbi:MAG TPA: sigma-70 family RNA polymerase sigma factor [Candidatus Krumholzibacteria bacterium]|nr:sigma-70 family RNA polymerase sigma factor [Candidatus Krumholzibacteria bacterium]
MEVRPHPDETPPSATAILLTRARRGDVEAREELFVRFVPVLRRWAHRRLPASARDLNETMDLVQITLLRALNRLEDFEARGEGAFLGYLRQILLNVVKEETRRSARRGLQATLDETLVAPHKSMIERVIGAEQIERYQHGLDRLTEEQRQAVILRLEFDYTYEQIAEAMDKPSPDAARMMVVRAVAALAEIIDGR